MARQSERSASMMVGVVVRRRPGVTRWAKYSWRAVAVLPNATPGDWAEVGREDDTVDFFAGAVPLTLWRTDTEAYRAALSTEPPSVYVVLRASEEPGTPNEFDVVSVTVSPFEAQDYADTAEEIVEPVPMPEWLVAWVRDFVGRHHVDDEFVKRRRDRVRTDKVEDGVGDPRIRQATDVYRSPTGRRRLN